MEKKPHVCWIDIPVDDVERSKKFYSDLFGWQIEKDQKIVPDSPSNNYFMIGNPETGEDSPSFLGGLIRREHPEQKITIYISVPSIEESLKKLEQLGGRAVSAVKSVPGWGYFALCSDPEKNTFALWEHNRDAD